MKHLFDRIKKAIAVGKHYVVELTAFFLINVARFQGLEIQLDRCDRRLELVRDGIQKCVVLFVSPYLAQEEDRVQDQPRYDQREENDADDQQDDFAKAKQDPADV